MTETDDNLIRAALHRVIQRGKPYYGGKVYSAIDYELWIKRVDRVHRDSIEAQLRRCADLIEGDAKPTEDQLIEHLKTHYPVSSADCGWQ